MPPTTSRGPKAVVPTRAAHRDRGLLPREPSVATASDPSLLVYDFVPLYTRCSLHLSSGLPMTIRDAGERRLSPRVFLSMTSVCIIMSNVQTYLYKTLFSCSVGAQKGILSRSSDLLNDGRRAISCRLCCCRRCTNPKTGMSPASSSMLTATFIVGGDLPPCSAAQK